MLNISDVLVKDYLLTVITLLQAATLSGEYSGHKKRFVVTRTVQTLHGCCVTHKGRRARSIPNSALSRSVFGL